MMNTYKMNKINMSVEGMRQMKQKEELVAHEVEWTFLQLCSDFLS